MIFELSKSAISPEAKKDLDQLAQIMRDTPSMKILLEGHTDKRGNAKKNQELSEERVAVTKDYLVKQGVVASNIQTKGWGDQKPLIVTKDIAEGKINRRVEVRILSR
jgi:OOP family OmpA-OmpF porin